MLKEAGATEVHVCISSPPMKHPCFYGIDVSSHEELMASAHSVDEMCDIIGADSLTFLSVEGMLEAIGRKGYGKNCGQCTACWTVYSLFYRGISNGNISRHVITI